MTRRRPTGLQGPFSRKLRSELQRVAPDGACSRGPASLGGPFSAYSSPSSHW